MLTNTQTHFPTPADVAPPRREGKHWPDIARQWNLVGSPLRPSAQDIAIYSAAIARWTQDVPRALILGVTPELYRLPWPKGSTIAAIDRTQGMIDMVWPGSPSAALCADWTEMPLETNSRSLALCDGGLAILAYPHGHAKVVRALHRVLVPEGLCVFRLYVPPIEPETHQNVLRELLAGKIPNINVLKLRLGMALQQNGESGVQLNVVWEALHEVAPDWERLASRLGWPLENLLAINTYRGCASRYHFVSVAQVRHLFTENPGGFTFEMLQTPAYELGERCPIIAFRRGL